MENNTMENLIDNILGEGEFVKAMRGGVEWEPAMEDPEPQWGQQEADATMDDASSSATDSTEASDDSIELYHEKVFNSARLEHSRRMPRRHTPLLSASCSCPRSQTAQHN